MCKMCVRVTAYVTIHRNKEWNRNKDLPGQRNTEYSSSSRRLQYRDTNYNRCTVTVNKKLNKHNSVSMSNYKTINNLIVYLLLFGIFNNTDLFSFAADRCFVE